MPQEICPCYQKAAAVHNQNRRGVYQRMNPSMQEMGTREVWAVGRTVTSSSRLGSAVPDIMGYALGLLLAWSLVSGYRPLMVLLNDPNFALAKINANAPVSMVQSVRTSAVLENKAGIASLLPPVLATAKEGSTNQSVSPQWAALEEVNVNINRAAQTLPGILKGAFSSSDSSASADALHVDKDAKKHIAPLDKGKERDSLEYFR